MKYFVLKFAISDKGGMKNDIFSFLDIYFITFSLDHNVKHCIGKPAFDTHCMQTAKWVNV